MINIIFNTCSLGGYALGIHFIIDNNGRQSAHHTTLHNISVCHQIHLLYAIRKSDDGVLGIN